MFSVWAYLLPTLGLVGVIAGIVRIARARTTTQRAVGIGLAAVGGVLLVLMYAGRHINEATVLNR